MQDLRANTEVIVTIGPFVDKDDGLTPETGVAVSSADEAELIKHGSTSVVDISGATWAAVTNADGYYSLTLTTSHTDTEGQLTIIVQDDSVCLPVRNVFRVLSEAAYDSLYAAKDDGFMDVNIKTVGRADTQETEADNLEAACSNYSATRGLSGTALPAAAADAAGGLPISDAGGLDLDTILDVAISTRSDFDETTDDVTLADGAHGGSSGVLTLRNVVIERSSTSPCIHVNNLSSGEAVLLDSSTLNGTVRILNDGSTGKGIEAAASGTLGVGAIFTGGSSGTGASFQGGTTGASFVDSGDGSNDITLNDVIVTSGLSTHSAADVLNTITDDNTAIDASALNALTGVSNISSLVVSAGGAVDSMVQGFLNNTIAETTADNIANNFETFYDNGDATSTSIIDDVENVAAILGTPGDLGSGATVGANLGDIAGAMSTADKMLGYFQLLARSDAAITSDRSTELSEINADEGSGAGDYAGTTESQEALRDHVGDGTNLTEAGGDGDHLTEAGGDGDHLTEAGGDGDHLSAIPKTGFKLASDGLDSVEISEPSGMFAWSGANFVGLVGVLGVLMRNEINSDSDSVDVRNDADSANLWTYSTSDDGSTFTSGEGG